MTRQEIAQMIAGIGLPYAYDHFTEEDTPGQPPFICFLCPQRSDFAADNINYAPITQLVVELYTDNVDFALEDRVETALNDEELFYTQAREYLDDEKMYLTTYTTEVYINA